MASAQLEELDYRKLYEAYSSKGRKSATDPRVMFKVMVYGYQCGIFSTRALEEACKYRVDFMWLLENEQAPNYTALHRFRKDRCAEGVIEDLFFQYVALLEKQGEVDHKSVFIDGTKIESRAGKYTFVWRGNAEKGLEKAQKKALELTGCKTLEELEDCLTRKKEGIVFASGKGKHKSQEQKEWETIEEVCQKWRKYTQQLQIMGESRKSYSKTDPDATFIIFERYSLLFGQKPKGRINFYLILRVEIVSK